MLIGRVDVGQPEAVGVVGVQRPSRYVREARDARREKAFDVFRIGAARRIAKTYLCLRAERHEALEHGYRRRNLHLALKWTIEGRSEIETHGNFGRNSVQKPRVFANRLLRRCLHIRAVVRFRNRQNKYQSSRACVDGLYAPPLVWHQNLGRDRWDPCARREHLARVPQLRQRLLANERTNFDAPQSDGG